MVSPAGDFVYTKFSSMLLIQLLDLLAILPSSVMILCFSFLSPCFFSSLKDQIASFQLKEIIVFLNCVPCVC